MRWTKWLFVFMALLVLVAPVQAAPADDDFLNQDEYGLAFGDKGALKSANLQIALESIKLVSPFFIAPKLAALVFSATRDGAGGFAALPFQGNGLFTWQALLGFVGTQGLTSSQRAFIQVDYLGAVPAFIWLYMYWDSVLGGLVIGALNETGEIGTPIQLIGTTFAYLRIVQTLTDFVLEARAYDSDIWQTVFQVARAPLAADFRLSFGVSQLAAGALVAFANVFATGALFGVQESFYLPQLYNYLALMVLVRQAMFLGDINGALSNLDSVRFGLGGLLATIRADSALGLFLQYTIIKNVLKFIQIAYKSSHKIQSDLERGRILRALPALITMYAYIQLATLGLRGSSLKKIDGICNYRRFAES